MIIELRSTETDELIEDGFIEVDDEIMLQAFVIASEENLPFNEWFNKMLLNYIDKSKNIIEETVKWTKEEWDTHLIANVSETYSMSVLLSALNLKAYGYLPKGIGLSGFQAEGARKLSELLPDFGKEESMK